jgi:hypothetical protein
MLLPIQEIASWWTDQFLEPEKLDRYTDRRLFIRCGKRVVHRPVYREKVNPGYSCTEPRPAPTPASGQSPPCTKSTHVSTAGCSRASHSTVVCSRRCISLESGKSLALTSHKWHVGRLSLWVEGVPVCCLHRWFGQGLNVWKSTGVKDLLGRLLYI